MLKVYVEAMAGWEKGTSRRSMSCKDAPEPATSQNFVRLDTQEMARRGRVTATGSGGCCS